MGFCYKQNREREVRRRHKGQDDKEILWLDGGDREDSIITLVMEGIERDFLIDTGAEVSVITEMTAIKIGGGIG